MRTVRKGLPKAVFERSGKDITMNTNIEFFDIEPIENLITCLNYKMDRVIYFGYKDTMTPERIGDTRKSLKRLCSITDAKFIEVSKTNLDRMLERIEEEIKNERREGHNCFFDLTGGEDLLLVAMGILSTKYTMPMHQYQVRTNRLIVLNGKDVPGIDKTGEERHVKFTLDDAIAIKGGVINYRQQKMSKSFLNNAEFERDMAKIWRVVNDNPRRWNGLSGVFKNLIYEEDGNLTVITNPGRLNQVLRKCSGINFRQTLVALRELGDYGILKAVQTEGDEIRFTYKNEVIRECLLDAGCPLELHTYFEKKNSGRYSDCRVGVHVDWDGVMNGHEEDVINEVDVLALEGFVTVFTSCKNGKVNQMALYELETVAGRFGGKYAKMELAATQKLSGAYEERAEEMEIKILYE